MSAMGRPIYCASGRQCLTLPIPQKHLETTHSLEKQAAQK
jgi:hypothetical protein